MAGEQDGRKLSHAALAEIRKRAVLRVEAGESPEQVIRALGFHRSCIYDWLAKYADGGLAALEAKPIPGRPPKLSSRQMQHLYRIIVERNPLQMRFEFALWTRAMARELIADLFEVKMSESAVGRLLRRLGLSPQKPLHRAYEQNPEAVQRWLDEEYPAIKRLAAAEGAVIYFEDEAGIRSDYHRGTTWAPVGQTPVIEATGARFRLNMVSAISAQGLLRFTVMEGKLSADHFIEFCKRLMRDSPQPVFLIVDGHPIHRAASVKKFVAASEGRLRLFFLPGYSPQLNPDELVWRHVKAQKIGRASLRGPDHMQRLVYSVLHRLQKTPALVRSFFRDPYVRYAAA